MLLTVAFFNEERKAQYEYSGARNYLMTSGDENLSMLPYALRFAGFYALVQAGLLVVFTVLAIEPNSGINIVMVLVSGSLVGSQFVKKHRRLFSSPERWRLIWLSLLATTIVSIVLSMALIYVAGGAEAITAFLSVFGELSPGVWMVIFAVVLAVYVLALWFSYGYLTKLASRRELEGG